MEKEETIHCPYCGEEILSVAKKCKHCGEWLDESARPNSSINYDYSNPTTLAKIALADKYDILEVIGSGGMATVYKAKQKSLGRMVALKIFHQCMMQDSEMFERFQREARIHNKT